jgi:hypothetical protein
MKALIQLVAGLLAGVIGAYAGLFALLSATGLDEPEWAPVAMLAGGALFGSATVTLIAKLPMSTVTTVTFVATVIGALVGLFVMTLGDSYDWTVGLGVLLIAAVVAVTRTLEPDDEPAGSGVSVSDHG